MQYCTSMSNVSGLSWLEFLHLFQCIHKVGIVLSCATLTMRLAVFAVRCCGHEGQFLKMPFRKVGKINTALARAYTTLNRLHLFVGNASSYCFAFVRVAIIEFAFLIADGRDGRQRPKCRMWRQTPGRPLKRGLLPSMARNVERLFWVGLTHSGFPIPVGHSLCQIKSRFLQLSVSQSARRLIPLHPAT